MRSHFCGSLGSEHIDQDVTICGWVDRRRDHGGVIFLDMRDREGIVQVVFDPDTEEHFATADRVRSEYVLKIRGRVRARDAATVNPNMKTGEIEVLGKEIEILNESETPPFQLDDHTEVGEDVRLRYRYLDLRRPQSPINCVCAPGDPVLRRYWTSRASWILKPHSRPRGCAHYLETSRTRVVNSSRCLNHLSCLSSC